MRRLSLVLAALLASAAPVAAGDVATLEVLGFTTDGSIFAFEEYGVQDGSGFPYANRFYIRTADDSFVPGTPVRVRLDDEAATVAQARDAARGKAAMIVDASELAANKGFAAGRNAVTEYSADPHVMRVNPRPVFPEIDAALEFRLTPVDAKPPAGCDMVEGVKGFRLERIVGGDAAVPVHEDDSVPASRGCPTEYSIVGIQTFYAEGGAPVFAVLIAIRRFGFEGPDFRYLALTGRI